MNLKNRKEILFLYDVTTGNPNGDPFYENRPRVDKENGRCLVTDVRLKRTIRDYLFTRKGYTGKDGKDIFIRQVPIIDRDGRLKGVKDNKARAEDFGSDRMEITAGITKKCIDIRMFGGVIPLVEDVITLIGPVQFRMGASLHRVEVSFIKGIGGFTSDMGYSQDTFRDEYIVPYALIGFYGIINENAAKDTNMTEDDVNTLIEGLWMGTKNLITRTKIGHQPRFLMVVTYKEPNYFIGELDKYVSLETELNEEKIRDVTDYTLNLNALSKKLNARIEMIEKIEVMIDQRFQVTGADSFLMKLDSLNLY